MPTNLILRYSAYVSVSVPNAIASKLKAQEGVMNDSGAPFTFYCKHGNIYFMNEDGEEIEIEGDALEVDYKRTSDGEWEDEEESSDEGGDREEESSDEGGDKNANDDGTVSAMTGGNGGHVCHKCSLIMSDTDFAYGKMCCDKPMFNDDHEEED